MRTFFIIFGFVIVTGLSILGFRGGSTTTPPVEIFPDMDRQPRYDPQGESDFFADGRASRPPVEGTVARSLAGDETVAAEHLNPDGGYRAGFPGVVSREMMERGRERYTIYCGLCHGQAGDGNGITTKYGMAVVPSFHIERLVEMPEGEIYEVITNGRGLMGSYSGQLSPEDRWNVIAYLRALQRSHLGTVEDVPAENRAELGL